MISDILTQTIKEFTGLISTHNRCAVIRPTGFGKTQLLVEYARNKRSLFIVPTHALKQDIKLRYPHIVDKCKIVLYSTLLAIKKRGKDFHSVFGDLEFICLDELHRAGAPLWSDAIKELLAVYKDSKIAGCSATPVRTDTRDMVEELFGGIQVSQYNLINALKDGVLPMPTYICSYYDYNNIYNEIDITKVKNSINFNAIRSDIDSRIIELSRINNAQSIISTHLKDVKGNMKFIVFCSDTKALETKLPEVEGWFKESFPTKSVKCYKIYNTLGKDNKTTLENFTQTTEADIQLLFSIDMISEGVHVPNTTGVILLRKTTSPILFSQQIGRCLQVNGQPPFIFDFVNNLKSTFRVSNRLRVTKVQKPRLDTTILPSTNEDFETQLYSSINVYDYTVEVDDCLDRIRGMLKSTSGGELAGKMIDVCNFFRKRLLVTDNEDTAIEETAVNFRTTPYVIYDSLFELCLVDTTRRKTKWKNK